MPLEPLIVEALFSFKGTNNDELCFKKGDLITVTQKDDEWWEGTFNDKTGWFPGNYVKERKDVLTTIVSQQNEYKGVVLNDLIDSEKAFVTEIEGLITNFLLPLEKTSILTLNEYKQLIGNITEIFETHQQLLKLVILENTKPGSDQRVGQLFLNWAQKIKLVHQAYCSMHPRAACIIDRFKDELNKYMESKGASCPGVLVLTTLLSKPFRRLEKYSGLLQELERHVEEFHSDRGDTQRSVEIYKDIASVCSATRRQKELELQVLTGPIRNWDNQSLSVLGDIICMSSVAVGPQHNDRYFVLFSSCLVILSVSQRLSAFIYEGELPLSGLNVARLDDSDSYKNAFEISSGSAEKKIVVCQSKEEANQWVELLKKNMMRNSNVSEISQKEHSSQTMFVPQPPPHLNDRGYSHRMSVLNYINVNTFESTFPPYGYPSAAPFATLTKFFKKCIKEKLINKKMLRNLLYPEYIHRHNLSLINIRHHRTECSIRVKNLECRQTVLSCDSDDSISNDCESRGPHAVDSISDSISDSSSSENNPFGYIRYYNPNKVRSETETKYESICTSIINSPDIKPQTKVTSTNIMLQKQASENSNASSEYLAKPSFAMENLTDLGGSFEINNESKNSICLLRQSCPTKMVGNKFSPTSMTSIYIPSYSNSDNNIVKLGQNNSPQSSTTTVSSTFELHVNVIPVPDQLLAEILYNQDSEHNKCVNDNVIDTEPKKISLNLNHIGFLRHSINSDKPKLRTCVNIKPRVPSSTEIRRCVSSQFLHMRNSNIHPSTSKDGFLVDFSSPRSSDSGMAGSFTINSPDLPNDMEIGDHDSRVLDMLNNKYMLSNISFCESEAQHFNEQCPCASPFGSTPRTSCETSCSSTKVTETQRNSREITSVTQSMDTTQEYDHFKMHSKSESIRDSFKMSARNSKSVDSLLECQAEDSNNSLVYKSGLYAHWWLKAKLPANILKGIYDSCSTSTDASHNSSSEHVGATKKSK